MIDLISSLSSLCNGFETLKKSYDHLNEWMSKPHGDEKEQLMQIKKYVLEWDILVSKLKIYSEKASILGDDSWPQNHKTQIQELGYKIARLGTDQNPLSGINSDYLHNHYKLMNALHFKLFSEGIGCDDFDDEDDGVFPETSTVSLQKFIYFIEFLKKYIDVAVSEIDKHIYAGCSGC